jgi:hypothetical protein
MLATNMTFETLNAARKTGLMDKNVQQFRAKKIILNYSQLQHFRKNIFPAIFLYFLDIII